MPIIDKGRTLKSWQNGEFSYTLHGTLAAGDYLGDTAAGTGLSMPDCTVTGVHYNAGTASGAGTDVTVHNVTQGTTAVFSPDAGAESVDVALAFNAGDELAIEVTAVDGTTAGSDVSLVVDYEANLISST